MNYIIDPRTNEKHYVFSLPGKKLLKQFVKQFNKKGGIGHNQSIYLRNNLPQLPRSIISSMLPELPDIRRISEYYIQNSEQIELLVMQIGKRFMNIDLDDNYLIAKLNTPEPNFQFSVNEINRFQQKHNITNFFQIYGLGLNQLDLNSEDIQINFIEKFYKLLIQVMDTKNTALALLIFIGYKLEILIPGIFNMVYLKYINED